VHPEDKFLLCSDGLTDDLSENAITQVMTGSSPSTPGTFSLETLSPEAQTVRPSNAFAQSAQPITSGRATSRTALPQIKRSGWRVISRALRLFWRRRPGSCDSPQFSGLLTRSVDASSDIAQSLLSTALRGRARDNISLIVVHSRSV
jgi:serine/threonine protein phosphatase PrpC